MPFLLKMEGVMSLLKVEQRVESDVINQVKMLAQNVFNNKLPAISHDLACVFEILLHLDESKWFEDDSNPNDFATF